jgi:hypothetical protein
MKTVVSLTGGYGSAYNLWNLAKSTHDEILAVFVDIEYFNSNVMPCPTGTHLSKRGDIFAFNQIVNWINRNVRKIKFVSLDLDNYDPQYSGIPQLEIINYARIKEYDKVIFNDDIKDVVPDQVLLRKVNNRLKGNYVIVEYPLIENGLTNFQCSKLLPSELKQLCVTNKIADISVLLENQGFVEQQIVEKQITVTKNAVLTNHKDPKKNKVWIADTDKDFGEIIFAKELMYQYPQYIKLWKEKV